MFNLKSLPFYSILLLALLFFSSHDIFASDNAPSNPEGNSKAASIQNTQQSAALESSASVPDKIQDNHQGIVEAETQKSEAPKPETVGMQSVISTDALNQTATKAVDKNISLFTKTIKERFSLWLSRSGRYLELMKGILKAKNIPEDIAFLSLIESGFNPSAYSVARAVGPWQFIASTGKRYGLKIDWWRDERKDPVKSTEAAAEYLSDLYQMFGSWNLAMAAYNAGEGKILKALNRTKSNDYWALLNTKHIKRETKEYVPRFIAATMIATNPQSYGFENLTYYMPLEYDEVIITAPVDLDVAARCADTTIDAIRELNPELRRWSTPANNSFYVLRIPPGKKDVFMENLSRIPEAERFTVDTYTIKKGDTYKSIAKKTGIPVSVVLELNNGIQALTVGEKIILPPKDKFHMDRDDRVRTASYRGKKHKNKKKKVVVAALHKKDSFTD